jgi:hypothetical protein
MKKIILLLILPFLLSFNQENQLKDGKYLSKYPGDSIYGIEILNNNTEIKFYLREKEDDNSNDWKTFGVGKIVKIKDRYFIEDITSKNNPYDKEQKVEMKVKGSSIEFKTLNLMSHLFNSFIRYSNNLKFELEQTK